LPPESNPKSLFARYQRKEFRYIIIQNKCGTTALFDLSRTATRTDVFKRLRDFDDFGIRGWRGTNYLKEARVWLSEYSHPPGAVSDELDISKSVEGKKIPSTKSRGDEIETGKLSDGRHPIKPIPADKAVNDVDKLLGK